MSEQTKYYSTADVAKRYKVTERAVRKWIKAGILDAEKTSPLPKSSWLIPQTAIEDFDRRRLAASE